MNNIYACWCIVSVILKYLMLYWSNSGFYLYSIKNAHLYNFSMHSTLIFWSCMLPEILYTRGTMLFHLPTLCRHRLLINAQPLNQYGLRCWQLQPSLYDALSDINLKVIIIYMLEYAHNLKLSFLNTHFWKQFGAMLHKTLQWM